MPDEIILDILPLLLHKHPLLNPPHRLPTLKLYQYLIGIDSFHEIEKDVALDGITCEIEGLIDLDKSV